MSIRIGVPRQRAVTRKQLSSPPSQLILLAARPVKKCEESVRSETHPKFLYWQIAPSHERQQRRSIQSGATPHAADTCRFGFLGQGQLMSANEPEERELTEEEMIAAMEQALAITPPSEEPTESAGSGSSSSLFNLGLIVAVVFPIAWGLSSARVRGAAATAAAVANAATAAAAKSAESHNVETKPAPPQFV